jgi:hypothetical protein
LVRRAVRRVLSTIFAHWGRLTWRFLSFGTAGTRSFVHFLQLVELLPHSCVALVASWDTVGEIHVIGKAYFVRQAAILFRFAKATKDPKISAALMEKAADLKLQVDDPSASRDLTPLAPDIEPPSAPWTNIGRRGWRPSCLARSPQALASLVASWTGARGSAIANAKKKRITIAMPRMRAI